MVLLTLVGILGLMMVLVVIFSFLTVAKRAEVDWLLLIRQVPAEKVQFSQPAEELTKKGLEPAPRASA